MSHIAVVGHRLVLAALPAVMACGGSLGAGGADAAAGVVGTGTGATGGGGDSGTGRVGLFGGGGSGVAGRRWRWRWRGLRCTRRARPRCECPDAGAAGRRLRRPRDHRAQQRRRHGDHDSMPARAADAGAPLPMHVELRQMSPMPRLPVGARVWLSKHPAGNQSQPTYFGVTPWALSVRNREGGDPLFGLSRNSPRHHLRAGPRRRGGSGVRPRPPSSCAPGSFVTYGSVEILGDRTVVVGDGETAVVPIERYRLRRPRRRAAGDAAHGERLVRRLLGRERPRARRARAGLGVAGRCAPHRCTARLLGRQRDGGGVRRFWPTRR